MTIRMLTWHGSRLSSRMDLRGCHVALAGKMVRIGIGGDSSVAGRAATESSASHTAATAAAACNSSLTWRSLISKMMTWPSKRMSTYAADMEPPGYLLVRESRTASSTGMLSLLPVIVICLASPVAKAKTNDDPTVEGSEFPSPEGSSADTLNLDDRRKIGTPPSAPEFKSNSHTARWRVFTDVGRNMFAQGRLEEAEKYFQKALEESKQGFGEEDPHVASSCNNLAEIYRVRRNFYRAEPLYLEAIERLEAAMGKDHQSVGLALHNLGGFYLLTKNLDKSKDSYEKSLKVKEASFGKKHPEYALTLFHLGEVIRLMGNVKDAEKLIRDSLRLLEESGGGYSPAAIKRMARLAEILVQSRQLHEAELLHRRILHIVELSKGSEGVEAANALENLAGTLRLRGKLEEASELLQRCLQIRQMVLCSDHMQVGSTLFKLGMITKEQGDAMANSKLLDDMKKAKLLYDDSSALLHRATRIAEQNWDQAMSALKAAAAAAGKSAVEKQRSVKIAMPTLIPRLMAVVQSLNVLGLTKNQIAQLSYLTQDAKSQAEFEAEAVFRRALQVVSEDAVLQQALTFAGVRKELSTSINSLSALLRKKKEEGRGSKELLDKELNRLERQAAKFR